MLKRMCTAKIANAMASSYLQASRAARLKSPRVVRLAQGNKLGK